MAQIDIGFIGAGARAQAHYTSVAAMDDVNIAAVSELDEERLSEAADDYSIEHTFTDYNEMLDQIDLDAVYVIMFPEYYDPIVTDVLNRGQNIFIEKPPGISSEQTRQWADLAIENGCKTAVGFQRRFHPLTVEARERIKERSEIAYGVGTYHKANLGLELHNDLVYDVNHIIDLLSWMGGGVSSAHGYYKQAFADPEEFNLFGANIFAGVIEFTNGGLGILSSNRAAGGRYLSFEMHGHTISAYGEIHGDANLDELVVQANDEPYAEVERITITDILGEDRPPMSDDGTFQINRHFIDCLKADRAPDPTFEATLDSMKTVEAILEGDRLPTTIGN